MHHISLLFSPSALGLHEHFWFFFFLASALAYFLGSVPSALLITRALKGKDVRNEGSGNIGTTNALRVGGPMAGALTLFFDAAKGFVALMLVMHLFPDPYVLKLVAGFFVVMGHIFPVWTRFRGGKGVATFLAVQLTLFWKVGLFLLLLWFILVLVVRYVSVASVLAAVAAPVSHLLYSFFLDPTLEPSMTLFSLSLALVIVFKHQSNLSRLRKNEEPKTDFLRKLLGLDRLLSKKNKTPMLPALPSPEKRTHRDHS